MRPPLLEIGGTDYYPSAIDEESWNNLLRSIYLYSQTYIWESGVMSGEKVASETLTSAHWFPCPGRWPWWCRHDLPKYSSEVQEVPEEEKPVLMPPLWGDWAETMHTPQAHTRTDTHRSAWPWCQPLEYISLSRAHSHPFSPLLHTAVRMGQRPLTAILSPNEETRFILKRLNVNSRARSQALISGPPLWEITIQLEFLSWVYKPTAVHPSCRLQEKTWNKIQKRAARGCWKGNKIRWPVARTSNLRSHHEAGVSWYGFVPRESPSPGTPQSQVDGCSVTRNHLCRPGRMWSKCQQTSKSSVYELTQHSP